MRKGLLLCIALLLCAIPSMAQRWSGKADLSLGAGASHYRTKGDFELSFRTEKFIWNTALGAKWEPNSQMAYKRQKMSLTDKTAFSSPLAAGIKTDFKWMPSSERHYSTWIQYQYKHAFANNHTRTVNPVTDESQEFSSYYEVPFVNSHNLEAGLKTRHSFDSGRHILHGNLAIQDVNSNRVNTWIAYKTDQEEKYAWKYRVTPSSTDLNIDGDIHLDNTLIDSQARLKLTPGVRVSTRQVLDRYSGATSVSYDNVKEVWKDSTRLRESFNYLSLMADHYVRAEFVWKGLEATFDYAIQVYGRRLNDSNHEYPLRMKGLYPVGTSNIRWNINTHHALNFSHQMSVSHPDYMKICWYDRPGSYIDQLYRGDQHLLSPQTLLYALDYEFKWGGFVSKTKVAYKSVINEIDLTWAQETIEGRSYKVFRWLNSADCRSLGLSQSFGWSGKVISANAGASCNSSSRAAKSNGAIKNSFDWRVYGDITANLGKGWSIGADAKYQSSVSTFFTTVKEYCEINARLQKEFKRIALYLEGNNLLDQPTTTSYQSDDASADLWVEEVRRNRRLLILGATWKF